MSDLVAIITKMNAGQHLTVGEELDFITAPWDAIVDAGREASRRRVRQREQSS